MIAWLVIQGTPPRAYIQNVEAKPFLDAGMASHQLLESIEPLRAGVDGENGNLGAILREGAMKYLAIPPLGATAIVWRVDEGIAIAEFTGTVQSITVTKDGVTVAVEQ